MVSFVTPDFPNNSELLFGADLLSAEPPSELYQMLPVSGFRDVQVFASGEPFVVFSEKPDIAELRDSGRAPVADNRIVSKSIGAVDLKFSIFGKREGRTQLVVVDKFGSTQSRMTVSVKALKPVNCRFWFLTDKLTSKPDGIEGIIRAAAAKIKALYLNQANIDLRETGAVKELHVDINLSRLDDRRTKTIFLEEPFAPQVTTDREDFIHQTLNDRGGSVNAVNLLATWRLALTPAKDRVFRIGGSTRTDPKPTNLSIVELRASTNSNVAKWAHEMAHALIGPGHQPNAGFLMSKVEGDSWRLRAAEIDALNPSGNSF